MRWLMLALCLLGFALAFVAKGPGLLGVGLLLGFVGLFGTVCSIAADRVSAGARPESAMLAPEDLAAMRAARTSRTAPPAGSARSTTAPSASPPTPTFADSTRRPDPAPATRFKPDRT